VGICGRTGAGKSSIMVALMRLADVMEGQILIDGLDTLTMGLHDVRCAMAIIPQEATLFKGTLRYNLVRKPPRAKKTSGFGTGRQKRAFE
jgi:ATP-binding cassette subfamily C (CFTR/MRP) protein 1